MKNKQNVLSIAALIGVAVAIIGCIGYYAWKNTQPLNPNDGSIRPVEFAPQTTEIVDEDGSKFTLGEARYALSGSVNDSFSKFKPVTINCGVYKLNIKEMNLVSANSTLMSALQNDEDWKVDFADYDLNKCMYIAYTTTDWTVDTSNLGKEMPVLDPETGEQVVGPDGVPMTTIHHYMAPLFILSTMNNIENDSVVVREEMATFLIKDNKVDFETNVLVPNETIYTIIPLEDTDHPNFDWESDEPDEGVVRDIRDLSDKLVLRLNYVDENNMVIYEWLLGDAAKQWVEDTNAGKQKEIEASMTLATAENTVSTENGTPTVPSGT